MTYKRPLALISDDEWIRLRWTEVTTHSDDERMFIVTGERTPDEAASAKHDLDYLRS